ncbi:MAG TPA: polysaccharide biosynthesis/export family protein [Polyangiaceae bacterium]
MARRVLPFVLPLGIALLHFALMLRAALHHTGGLFGYAVDDAYIHLALAKHLALNGVYGVTRHAFTAASSSVVWPFLLAGAMRLFGDQIALPAAMNLVATVGLVAVVATSLAREAPGLSPTVRAAVGVAVVLLMPVASLVLVGMEHILHAALTVAFVVEAARVIAGPGRRGHALVALAFTLAATRYEGLFPVGIAAALLLLRRRAGLAAALLAAAAAPIVVFGLFSMAHGGLFFPTSIALKRQRFDLTALDGWGDALGGNVLDMLSRAPYLLPLVLGPALLLTRALRRGGLFDRDSVRLLLAFGTTLAHVELATAIGWFNRYEAYLVALDLTVCAISLGSSAPFSIRGAFQSAPLPSLVGALAIAAGTGPLWVRAMWVQGATPLAVQNIFQQQVQTARFLGRYFPNDPVAVNDIGAVAYYGDEPIVDLVGIATLDIAKAKSMKHDNRLTAAQVTSFTKDAPVAVVYEEWVANIPASWVRLARLRIDSNKVCALDHVAVYATSGEAVPRVLAALREFAPSLPPEVRREGRWMERPPETLADWRADAGDLLRVDIPGAKQPSAAVSVREDGSFVVPGVGEVKARGLTLPEIQAATLAKMKVAKEPLPAGAVPSVELLEERAPRVRVAGDILHPIDEASPAPVDAAQAVASAGALRPAASPYVWHEDDGRLVRTELADARAVPLRGGDIVIVP